MRQQTATKALSAGGVTGGVTALVMLVMHFSGQLHLSQSDMAAVAVSIGSAMGTGVTAALSAYIPRNRPK